MVTLLSKIVGDNKKLVTCYQKWYQNVNKMVRFYQKLQQSDNMLPKMVKNDYKIVKRCKNGKLLTKMVTKC